jgi:uncharacterized protein (UPF0297 family)
MKQYKSKKREESQIEWKNTSHDPQFNPVNRFYGVIKVGDKNYITEYESKFRSEVTAIFEEEARLSNGVLTTVGVFK